LKIAVWGKEKARMDAGLIKKLISFPQKGRLQQSQHAVRHSTAKTEVQQQRICEVCNMLFL
jgi:hypothetical protein